MENLDDVYRIDMVYHCVLLMFDNYCFGSNIYVKKIWSIIVEHTISIILIVNKERKIITSITCKSMAPEN